MREREQQPRRDRNDAATRPAPDAEVQPQGRTSGDWRDQLAYRLSGGKAGTAPCAEVNAQRAAVIGGAVEREQRRTMLKSDGGGKKGGVEIPKGAGTPLAADVRSRLEPEMGADLSGVRVHTGGESAAAAKGFGARAFAVGQDIHFGAGEFAPGTKEGDRLLAHEAAHTVQAQKSGIQRKADGASEHGEHSHEVSTPDEPAEIEADAVADHVADKLHGEKAGDPGKEKAPTAHAPPKISAKLDGVGRKVFLAKPDRDPTTPRKDERPVPQSATTQGGVEIQIKPGALDHVLKGHTVENFDPVARLGEISDGVLTSIFPPGFATNQQEIVTLVKQALANKDGRKFDPTAKRVLELQLRKVTLQVWVGPVGRSQPGAFMLNSVFPKGGVSLTYDEVKQYADAVRAGKKTLPQVRRELLARFK